MTGSFTIKRAQPKTRSELDYYDSLTGADSKPQSSRSGGRGRGRGRWNKKKKTKPAIDISKFINKIDHKRVAEVQSYVPTNSFKDFAFERRVRQAVDNKGFDTPTEIQDKAIPLGLEGRDVVGLSATGTGKTVAFLLPILDQLFRCRLRQALIMAPTRELAIQINDELHDLHQRRMFVFSTVLVGGLPAWRQIKQLQKDKNHVIIGTPGRIMDLIDRGKLDLSQCDCVVLDEADRMLDMGFIDDMRYVMRHVPERRQTLFFSATMSKEIENLVGEFLTNPETISVKTRDTSEMVDQDVVRLEGRNRIEVLTEILKQEEMKKTIVFVETKRDAEQVAAELQHRGINADSIHGDRDHFERQRALKGFVQNKTRVLVATDVAGRGIDIKGITHVINYHVPTEYEDYVHRIGRTGRAGEVGHALTFVD